MSDYDELVKRLERAITRCTSYGHDQTVGEIRGAIDAIESLQARIKELEDPNWETFINLSHKWLEKYPPDIFDGSSGDSGPLFVVALRAALSALPEPPE